MRRSLSALSLLALAAASHAQLVFGTTTSSTGTPTPAGSGAFYLNVDTANAVRLWNGTSNRKVNGLANDAATGTLYENDSARLYRWSYGSAGTLPTAISGLYRASSAGGTLPTGADDLTFARGNLYAYTSFPATTAKAGFYRVDTSVVGSGTVPNMFPVWTQNTNADYLFKGTEYDPASGLVYATNTNVTTGLNSAPGIYTIDIFNPNATPTKIADFDANFLPNADGLTIGNGKLWLSYKSAGTPNLLIESYNLTTHTFDDAFSFDIGDTSAQATGLTWAPGALNPVPEPAAFLPLGLALAYAVRRRRLSTPA